MNIFAEQLVDVLHKHDHELSNLFNWRVQIPPSVVVRLKASLTGDRSATLNGDQIDFIAAKFGFDGDDHRRLRAALVAEGVRRLLADRLSVDLAYQLGMVTLRLLLSDDPHERARACDVLLTEVRAIPEVDEWPGTTLRGLNDEGISDRAADPLLVAAHAMVDVPPLDDDILLALEGAQEAYHQGLLWLEIAQDTGDRRARAGQAAQAGALFDRAAASANACATVAQATIDQTELLAAIASAAQAATTLR